MKYPKQIVLYDPLLKELLVGKGDAVTEGRGLTDQITTLEEDMGALDKELQKLEQGIDLGDIEEQAARITAKFNKIVKEMDAVKEKIFKRITAKLTPEMKVKRALHENKTKEKVALEEERVKVGLKIQLFNDKLKAPVEKLRNKYCKEKGDTLNTLELINGAIVLTVSNDFDDYEKAWDAKQLAPKNEVEQEPVPAK